MTTQNDDLQKIHLKNAQNALAEAAERRASNKEKAKLPKEVCKQRKAEPTRYGDWERNGIASDF